MSSPERLLSPVQTLKKPSEFQTPHLHTELSPNWEYDESIITSITMTFHQFAYKNTAVSPCSMGHGDELTIGRA